MVQMQVKLRLNKGQESTLVGWLWNLTAVWNWAVRKIELDAKDHIYHGIGFLNLLASHGEKLGIPSHTLQGILSQAQNSWKRCFNGLSNKPRLKG